MGSHRQWKHARWTQDGVCLVMTETAPNCSPFLPRRTYFPRSLRLQPNLVTQAESWTHQHPGGRCKIKEALKAATEGNPKKCEYLVGSIMVGKHFWLKSEEFHLPRSSQHTVFSLFFLFIYILLDAVLTRFWGFWTLLLVAANWTTGHSVVGFSYNLLILIFRVKECQ